LSKLTIGYFFIWALLGHSLQAETISIEKLRGTLQEAKDYTHVVPTRSFKLLKQQQAHINILNPGEQIQWHLTFIRAALQLQNLPQVQTSLEQLLLLKQHPGFQQEFSSIVNAFGIWLRKSGYIRAARLCYACALDFSKNKRQRLSILVNLGISYRNLEQLDAAIAIYQLSHFLASNSQSQQQLAVIENNLGVLHLHQQRYEQASIHFLTALNLNQTLARRSGQILSGINLLLAYLYNQQHQQYQRVFPRVKRLLLENTHIPRNAYLQLVHSAYTMRQGQRLSAQYKAKLQQAFHQLNDKSLQVLLLPLTQELGLHIQFNKKNSLRNYQGNWLRELDQCQWHKYQKNDYIQKLTDRLQTNI